MLFTELQLFHTTYTHALHLTATGQTA